MEARELEVRVACEVLRCSECGEASLECAEYRPLRLGVDAVAIFPMAEGLRFRRRTVRSGAGEALWEREEG